MNQSTSMTDRGEFNYRPISMTVRYLDPFDDRLIFQEWMPYDPRKAAEGCYSRGIRYIKDEINKVRCAARVLRGRKPKVIIKFFPEKAKPGVDAFRQSDSPRTVKPTLNKRLKKSTP